MTTIRMDSDEVRTAAWQVDKAAGDLYLKPSKLRSAANSLSGLWQGGKSSHFASMLRGLATELRREVISLQRLATQVRNEVAEWESVAASLNLSLNLAAYAPAVIGTGILRPSSEARPAHMRDLAASVASLYARDENGNYTPIRVVKIGANEYLVMLAGTVGGTKSNNWFSAFTSGAGLPSDYQAQIKTILLALPAGALVHMAGHSKGGIMGNNLAADREVQNHLKVKSVTTFGSPVSAEPQTGVEYSRFAAVGDVVPLASNEAFDVLRDIQGLKIPELVKDVQDLNQVVIPGPEAPSSVDLSSMKDYVLDAHSIYGESKALSNYELPFEISQWEQGVYYYPENATASLPGIDVEFGEFVDQAYHAVIN